MQIKKIKHDGFHGFFDRFIFFRKHNSDNISSLKTKNFFIYFFKNLKYKIFTLFFIQILFFSGLCALPIIVSNYVDSFLNYQSNSQLIVKNTLLFLFLFTYIFFIFNIKKIYLFHFKNEIEKFIKTALISKKLSSSEEFNFEKSDHLSNFFSHHKIYKQIVSIFEILFFIPFMFLNIIFLWSFLQFTILFFLFLLSLLSVFYFYTKKNKTGALFHIEKEIDKKSKYLQSMETSLDLSVSLSIENNIINKSNYLIDKSLKYSKKFIQNNTYFFFIKNYSLFFIFLFSYLIYSIRQETIYTGQMTSFTISILFFYFSFLKIIFFLEEFHSIKFILKNLDLIFNKKKTPINEINNNYNIIQNKEFQSIKLDKLFLQNVNYEFKIGSLIGIVGFKNSETSNFLKACAQEINIFLENHTTKLHHSREFLPQKSFVFSGTLKENILCGREFQQERYLFSLKSSFLMRHFTTIETQDIWADPEFLSDEIKKKISLARLLYSSSEFYFLDLPFQYLNREEASCFFHETLQKNLSTTTRFILLDNFDFSAFCDSILVIHDGSCKEVGNHDTLLSKGLLYSKIYDAAFRLERENLIHYLNHSSSTTSLYSSKENTNEIYKTKRNTSESSAQLSPMKNMLYLYFSKFPFYSSNIPRLISILFFCFSVYLCFSTDQYLKKNSDIISFSSLIFISVTLFIYSCLVHSKNIFRFCINIEKKYTASVVNKKNQSELKKINYFNVFLFYFENFDSLFFYLLTFIITSTYLLIFNPSFYLSFVGIFLLYLIYFSYRRKKIPLIKEKYEKSILAEKTIYQEFISSCSFSNSYFITKYLSKKYLIQLNEKISTLKQKHKIYFETYQILFFLSLLVMIFFLSFFFLHSSFTIGHKISLTFIFSIIAFYSFYKMLKIHFKLTEFKIDIKNDLFENIPKYNNIYKYELTEFWPEKGKIHFEKIKFIHGKYIDFKNTEKIILVQDKSLTALNFLYKIFVQIEPLQEGKITVDDTHITFIHDKDLRKKVGIIHNSSYFLNLSIRENINIYENYDDCEIWNILDIIGASKNIALLKNGIDSKISEFIHENFWTQEIILLSFARCILNKNKIIFIEHLDVSEEFEKKLTQIIQIFMSDRIIFLSYENKSFQSLQKHVVFKIS